MCVSPPTSLGCCRASWSVELRCANIIGEFPRLVTREVIPQTDPIAPWMLWWKILILVLQKAWTEPVTGDVIDWLLVANAKAWCVANDWLLVLTLNFAYTITLPEFLLEYLKLCLSRDFFTATPLGQICQQQWRTQKILEGGQVSSQSCDVINQLWDDDSRGAREHAPGRILQNYT